MRYGAVYSSFWESTQQWPTDARVMAMYLLTCEHCNMVGCFKLPAAYAAADIGWEQNHVEGMLDILTEMGFIERDGRWVRVVNYLKWNPIANPNHAKTAVKCVSGIRSPTLAGRVAGDLLNTCKHINTASRSHLDGICIPSGCHPDGISMASASHPDGIAIQEQEQKQEQKQEQDQCQYQRHPDGIATVPLNGNTQTHTNSTDLSKINDHYTVLHPKRRGVMGDPEARLAVLSKLEHYTVEEVCQAIGANAADPWAQSRRQHSLKFIMRDDMFHKYLELAGKAADNDEYFAEREQFWAAMEREWAKEEGRE